MRSARAISVPWFPALLVTFAGFCSLVYQVVWERIYEYQLDPLGTLLGLTRPR
jgi:hypothetical protein